jgi:hypothetical protein
VGDEHDRDAAAPPQRQQVVVQPMPRDLVEGGERLVHQQQARRHGERAGQRDAHLHAARQLARPGALEARQPDLDERLGRPRLALALRHAAQLERQGDVGERRRPRHQGRLLEDEAELFTAPRIRPFDRARGGLGEAGDQPQQGRLAAARWAQHARERAGLDIERDIGKGGDAVGEGLGNAADPDQPHQSRIRSPAG